MSEPGRKRVLVLDDDVLMGIDLGQMIEECGHHILGPYSSVAAALAACSREAPDFAILDFNLGRETSAAVADHLQAEGIRFAFLTGYERRTLPDRFAEARILEKPIIMQALSAVLDETGSA